MPILITNNVTFMDFPQRKTKNVSWGQNAKMAVY